MMWAARAAGWKGGIGGAHGGARASSSMMLRVTHVHDGGRAGCHRCQQSTRATQGAGSWQLAAPCMRRTSHRSALARLAAIWLGRPRTRAAPACLLWLASSGQLPAGRAEMLGSGIINQRGRHGCGAPAARAKRGRIQAARAVASQRRGQSLGIGSRSKAPSHTPMGWSASPRALVLVVALLAPAVFAQETTQLRNYDVLAYQLWVLRMQEGVVCGRRVGSELGAIPFAQLAAHTAPPAA